MTELENLARELNLYGIECKIGGYGTNRNTLWFWIGYEKYNVSELSNGALIITKEDGMPFSMGMFDNVLEIMNLSVSSAINLIKSLPGFVDRNTEVLSNTKPDDSNPVDLSVLFSDELD